ncbi:hypothetical protein NSK_001665 [Nannochloropsis salina CCMP1776]|uniref:Uncharacterized protein n=1 Tax=Nannochloropsis salina CCMP1776 TaxID=1027361 RepID=A0A4D9DBB9_9STRA|nr:hypothetical protein NSK_001665 [Nannochloropsis salina CCMP1776]|eukprot:TFJ87333.1 hypothetical protein NSK_001665 [Nannochloropsis salina CCMP1776]
MGRESLIHALAGGLGSALALALTYPLDQVRTFQQVNDTPEDDEYINHGGSSPLLNQETCPATSLARLAFLFRPYRTASVMVQRHGAGALYRGMVPVLISMGLSNAVFFFVSNLLKAILSRYRQRTGKSLGYFGHLATGTIAGVLNVVLTTPLWVAGMRAKLSSAQGWNILTIMAKIWKDEGIMALWSGMIPSLLLVCNPVLQHFVYDVLKRRTLATRRVRSSQLSFPPSSMPISRSEAAGAAVALTSLEAFYFGAVGKFVATVVSYPLQVAQSRLRQQSQKSETDGIIATTSKEEGKTDRERELLAQSANHYTGTLDCLLDLWRRKGVAGLFQGVESKLLQTVVTSAFMFLAYEHIFKVTKGVLDVTDRKALGGKLHIE